MDSLTPLSGKAWPVPLCYIDLDVESARSATANRPDTSHAVQAGISACVTATGTTGYGPSVCVATACERTSPSATINTARIRLTIEVNTVNSRDVYPT